MTTTTSVTPLPTPPYVYDDRRNSKGYDLGDPTQVRALVERVAQYTGTPYHGGPLIAAKLSSASVAPDLAVHSPTDLATVVGYSRDTTPEEISAAFDSAAKAVQGWAETSVETRATALERAATALDADSGLFLSLLVREAGKTIPDAIAEIREAIDFCRYYAARARELLGSDTELRGPTGELNVLSLHARGVFACISPWNFPLAIYAGQITAALVTGNAVVAKPAPETPLIAHAFTKLLHEAGVPREVLQLTPASGVIFGAVAFKHPELAGVVFTGSTATAKTINQALALREGAILPLIAETGGINAMIVDSTALPEQVVDDVITSAFGSAGQRCSALRVLYLQEEVADHVIELLIGAMQELDIGDPARIETDVGPVISKRAADALTAHAKRMESEAKLLFRLPLSDATAAGHFVAPCLFELCALDQLDVEAFGPILHVARVPRDELPRVFEAIERTGYGLTLGVHSRRKRFADEVFGKTRAGNTYVNRNMIGAVVGVQPFGGTGLSGTGPKAGGPHYLLRFVTERTLTINTAAIGGNVSLLANDAI